MKIEIWSDVVCPWCYVGKRRFETALAQFDHRDDVDVVWRAFELDPAAPAERPRDYVSHLAAKYGISPAEAQAMIDRMVSVGAGVGVDMRFDIARPGNTFDAHRLVCLAGEHGAQDRMVQRLFEATFTEGRPIGHRETLVALATEVGLDEHEVRAALAGERYAPDVRAEEREARELGISAVPFFVIDRAYGVAGAQRPDAFLQVLEEAWRAAQPSPTG